MLLAADLPTDEDELGRAVDVDGAVIARAAPEDELRIARALRARGHVVVMTGDVVNDGPALREADIGIVMGRRGTDVAREAADLVVLLDDHFPTIVAADRYGPATFANIRKFLTYHLTDNIAELAPFLLWTLSTRQVPLALGVLQVLALDIGTDFLPALALGAEPPSRTALSGPARTGALIDRPLLVRVFGALGPAQALVELAAFLAVLHAGGWRWGEQASPALLATASCAALTQHRGAGSTRERRPVGRWSWRGNPLLLGAIAVELAVLAMLLALPPFPAVLGGTAPTILGCGLASLAIPAVLLADLVVKHLHRRTATPGEHR